MVVVITISLLKYIYFWLYNNDIAVSQTRMHAGLLFKITKKKTQSGENMIWSQFFSIQCGP